MRIKLRYTSWSEYTSDSMSLHNRVHKDYLERQCLINCGLCRYHRGENLSKPENGWKAHRKTQYRVKSRSKAVWYGELEDL